VAVYHKAFIQGREVSLEISKRSYMKDIKYNMDEVKNEQPLLKSILKIKPCSYAGFLFGFFYVGVLFSAGFLIPN